MAGMNFQTRSNIYYNGQACKLQFIWKVVLLLVGFYG